MIADRIDWSILAHRAPTFLVFVLGMASVIWAVARWSNVAQRARALRALIVLLVYFAVAGQALMTFAFDWGFQGDVTPTGLEAMLSGRANRPFVYRRLAPDAIRVISRTAERMLKVHTVAWLEDGSPARRFAEPDESWDRQKALDFHAAYAFVFLSYFATLWLARAWTRRLWPLAPRFADFAPPVGLVLWLYTRPWFFYDASELVLLFASALCITERRIWLHVPVFLLAVYGKESNLLLAPIAFVALRGRIPSSHWRAAGAVEVLGGLTIVLAIRATYARNGGVPLEYHLADNIMFWTDWHNYILLRDVFAPLVRTPSGGNVLLVSAVVGLVAMGWPESPPIVRSMLVTSLILVVPLVLLFAARDELRNFSIVFPGLYAVGCAGMRRLYATDLTSD